MKKKNNYLKYKKYAHFDKKMSINKAKQLLKNEETIKKHGFYPFIHFQIKSKKLEKINNKIYAVKEPKIRDIYYSAHMDRYIYQHYAYLIGKKYNEYAKSIGIDECSLAYRIEKGKCNIDFSYTAFNFIKKKDCIVIIGDFTHFFDNLNHKALKERLEKVINEKLDNQLYKVYKSITKFRYVNIEDIYNYLTERNGKRSEKYYLRKLSQIMTTEEFRSFIKSKNNKTGLNNLNINDKNYGIVQGSPLSGLFANIYMIEFDKNMNNLAKEYNGLYLRYSDDFIIVLENMCIKNIKDVYEKIQKFVTEAVQIELKQEKTNIYSYVGNTIKCVNKEVLDVENKNNIISFLGFTFDGENIMLRNKTLTKYYYKLYRTVKRYKKDDSKISKKKIYDKFSTQGVGQKKGNFISYVKRSEKVFCNEKKISKINKKSKQKVTEALSKK